MTKKSVKGRYTRNTTGRNPKGDRRTMLYKKGYKFVPILVVVLKQRGRTCLAHLFRRCSPCAVKTTNSSAIVGEAIMLETKGCLVFSDERSCTLDFIGHVSDFCYFSTELRNVTY